MYKTLFGNTLLLGAFLLLLVIPLGSFWFLHSPSPTSEVLSATTSDFGGQLSYGHSYKPVLLQEVTATAFSAQKADYSDVLWVTNTEGSPRTYKVTVIRNTSLPGVSSTWLFNNSQPVITLNPGESSSVSLEIVSTNPLPTVSADFLVAIED